MHRLDRKTALFFSFSCLVLGSTSALLAAGWPAAHEAITQASRSEASKLIAQADAANQSEASIDYKLATWLDSSNTAGYLGLAQCEITAGHPEVALSVLERAGKGSDATRLGIRTLIELGRTNEAANQAGALATPGSSDSDLILAGLAYALAERSQDIPALIASVSSPEAATRLELAEVGNVPLAGELYLSGLPESSKNLLTQLPTSFERNLLLARIYYSGHTQSDLATATDYLTSAISLNPQDIDAHQLLANVYSDSGRIADGAVQKALAQNITSGKP